MKRLIPAAAIATVFAGGAASADDDAWKQRKVEVSTMAGAHVFAPFGDGVELGVPDARGAAQPNHSVLLGLRALYRFREDFSVEGELALVPTTDTGQDDGTVVAAWRLHLVAPLGYEIGPLNSQLAVGAGALTITGDGSERRHDEISGDTDFVAHWGVTGRWMLSDALHLRGDARHLLVPSTEDFRFTSDFEFHVGVAYLFDYGVESESVTEAD